MDDENEVQFDTQAWKDELNSQAFKHGMDVGHSMGLSEAHREAQRAFEMGELELWVQHVKAKTMEEWDAWEKEHPRNEMENRWK